MKVNEEGLYQCFGRMQGEHPIFIPKESVLAEIMAKIRSEYWIHSLRQIVKKTIKKCYEWKRIRVCHYPEPSMGLLPVERTSQNLPWSIVM